jgi:hypothetical protein
VITALLQYDVEVAVALRTHESHPRHDREDVPLERQPDLGGDAGAGRLTTK